MATDRAHRSPLSRIFGVFLVSAVMMAPAAASAPLGGLWVFVQALAASDGRQLDNFGVTVDIEGDRAIIGARFADASGPDSGAAYIYERDATGVWVELQKLATLETDGYGYSVSISGDRAIVGQASSLLATADPGFANVFERDAGGTWNEVEKLAASDGEDFELFGGAVAIYGDWAIVGAQRDDALGTNSGSAYFFERDIAGNWVETQKVTASDGTASDSFGESLSIFEDRAIVGAQLHDVFGTATGAAYVFERDATDTWAEVQELTASDGAIADNFGASVSLDGDRAIVGAKGKVEGADAVGAAYLFERDAAGVWVELQKMLASDGEDLDNFGRSVSIDGDRAIVGTDKVLEEKFGAAYVFERDVAGSWLEVQKLPSADGSLINTFGGAVSISGGLALVGAAGQRGLGIDTGVALMFAAEEDCVMHMQLASRVVRPGGELRVAVDVQHNRSHTVLVPFRVWIEDADGMVIVTGHSAPRVLRFGDTRDQELSLRIPENLAPGTYVVFAGLAEMRQGVASAAQPFRVLR